MASLAERVQQEIDKRSLKVTKAQPTQTISGVVQAQPNTVIRPPGFVGPLMPVQQSKAEQKAITKPLPQFTPPNTTANTTPATVGYKAIEQQNSNVAKNFFTELPGALGKTVQTLARAPLRAAVATDASIANNPNPIAPETKLQKFLVGEEPITPIARQTSDLELSLKNKGVGNASLPLALTAIVGSTAMDLTPLGLGGSDAKLGKQAISELTELLGKGTAKDEALNIIYQKFGTKVAKVVEEKALPKIEQQLAKQSTEGVAKNSLPEIPKPKLPPIDSAAPAVKRELGEPNLNRMNISEESKQTVKQGYEQVKGELEAISGKKVTHDEIKQAAQDAGALQGVMTKEENLKFNAAVLNTRENLAKLASGKVTPELLETLKTDSTNATAIARSLESRKIKVGDQATALKLDILKRIQDSGVKVDEIIKAAEKVDFNDADSLTNFFRNFIKPNLGEIINEYRYANMLSSPKTHVVNLISNLSQGLVMNPLTRLVSGSLDTVASALTGQERQVYAKEVAPYFRGMFSHIPDAIENATDVLAGKSLVGRPDVEKLGTGLAIMKPFQYVTRALEASDVFMRGLINAGETEARVYRAAKSGANTSAEKVMKEAYDAASYWIFRQKPDSAHAINQGHVLRALDSATEAIYSLRQKPYVGKLVSWFVPFVETPMNILKQGVEFSPLGFSTLAGSGQKTEQLAKALIGSSVFAGSAYAGLQGRLTWAAPTGEKEKQLFYASGRQPYSIKIGNKWVSFSRIGPLAYPMAMAAALQWHLKENPSAVTRTKLENTTRALGGITQFFSDQSYMQGVSDLVGVLTDEPGAWSQAASNIPGQMVPLAALQRWVSQLVDPIYRKPEKGLSIESVIQNLQSGIPWASKSLPAYTDPFGRPEKRALPGLNSLNPATVSPAQPLPEMMLQGYRAKQKTTAITKNIKEMINKEIEKRIQSR